MKRIKVVFENGVYSIQPNDGVRDNVVFECDTNDEWTDFLSALPQPPQYIVIHDSLNNV